MAEEDQTQKYSNNSSSGVGNNIVRSSKKQKPKKAPQRGLGVAQLERIRLEEQQKKDAAFVSATVLPSSQSTTLSATKSSSLSVLTPNYHPSDHSSSSPIPFPFPPDLSSPKSLFRPPSSVQNVEILNSNTVPLTNTVGWSSVPIQGQGNVHKLYNSCEYNLQKESSGVDPGSTFRSSLSNLPYESIPIWPLPSLMQRAQQFQHPSSSMVTNLQFFAVFLRKLFYIFISALVFSVHGT